ncbi:hypothetical protein GCM10007872_19650 [Gluconobacter sphaericus NBRC 12467]|uniref:DUF1640 domain-containing protein n=2 Tax=Gluconobacter sphaericus TaxID=574987 RepID=A0AA37WA72_9PROT|nr:hypothetical protein AA12467_1848 [Gluconobacter sphaericus NBRC 12467]GEB42198.1 hypothetical protein GSP01_09800 [Gluconobacter sphaericus NBRC 12467]GLQ84788.1 hypothetical protein GCM10007872_16960 [Gluconobacter sphaericus NBRC 12467]GLQ85057.1 hypothetical protein GCM10007872_19650 [Gluconobacter sphaericus NBRC 12467]
MGDGMSDREGLAISLADGNERRAYTLRMLEDRVLRLETIAGGLSDRYEELRTEMRQEISSLRDQMKLLEAKVDEGNRVVNGKLDRLIGGRAVITGIITLVTSILGTGMVHFALSLSTK